MTGILALWLPILLSAVAVFILSSIVHMMLPLHKADYDRLPDEDAVLDAMRAAKVGQGNYMFPYCTSKEMGSDEMKQKWERGPVGFLNVLPKGQWSMGRSMTIWFIYTVVIGVLVAYVTGRTLAPGTHYLEVFRVSGTVAFVAYAAGTPMDSIWKGQRWGTTVRFIIDGLIYSLFTAGVFGWLWPH